MGGRESLAPVEGGEHFFPVDQRGDQDFLRVKEGDQIFFLKFVCIFEHVLSPGKGSGDQTFLTNPKEGPEFSPIGIRGDQNYLHMYISPGPC